MIEYFNNHMASFWFFIGFLLLAIEVVAFGFATGLLLFGSIGALVTGALMWLGFIPATWWVGIAAFTLSSVAAAVVLWKPLQRMQSGAKLGEDRSSDLIGHEFRLDQMVTPTSPGKTRYSGVDWRVELSDDSAVLEPIEQGKKVRVSRVGAGVFFVSAVL